MARLLARAQKLQGGRATPSRDRDEEFFQLFAQGDDPLLNGCAPSSLKSRLYSALVRKQQDPCRRKKEGAKVQHLKGKISDHGKSFTTDKGKTYTIENSKTVKGHEGHNVRLSGHVDPSASSIHVRSVKMAGEKASKDKICAMSKQPPK
jgi:hypothetical protein